MVQRLCAVAEDLIRRCFRAQDNHSKVVADLMFHEPFDMATASVRREGSLGRLRVAIGQVLSFREQAPTNMMLFAPNWAGTTRRECRQDCLRTP
jgi:hypothetical protein